MCVCVCVCVSFSHYGYNIRTVLKTSTFTTHTHTHTPVSSGELKPYFDMSDLSLPISKKKKIRFKNSGI